MFWNVMVGITQSKVTPFSFSLISFFSNFLFLEFPFSFSVSYSCLFSSSSSSSSSAPFSFSSCCCCCRDTTHQSCRQRGENPKDYWNGLHIDQHQIANATEASRKGRLHIFQATSHDPFLHQPAGKNTNQNPQSTPPWPVLPHKWTSALDTWAKNCSWQLFMATVGNIPWHIAAIASGHHVEGINKGWSHQWRDDQEERVLFKFTTFIACAWLNNLR